MRINASVLIHATGLPDPLEYDPDEIVSVKQRTYYNQIRYLRKYRSPGKRSVLTLDLPTQLLPAKEIKVGDWLLFPKRANLPAIDLTPDQLYVIGFWLADGHHLKESKKGTSAFGQPVGLAFTNTNRALLERIQQMLNDWFPGSASHIRAERTGTEYKTKYVLEFRSWPAARFFLPNFGEYAYGKFIGPEIFEHSALMSLLLGFIDGDGCQFSKGRRLGEIAIVTTSKNLAYQLRQILLDEGIWVTLQYHDKANKKHHRIYTLRIPKNYAHLLAKAQKVTDPGAGTTNNLAIPAPEGFYSRVKAFNISSI